MAGLSDFFGRSLTEKAGREKPQAMVFVAA